MAGWYKLANSDEGRSLRRRRLVLDGLGTALVTVAVVGGLPAGCAHPVYGDPKAPLAARALGTTIHTANAEELRYVALQLLTDRYAAQQGITVSTEEKQAYVRSVRRAMAKELTLAQTRRDELARRLASDALPAAEQERLMKELELARDAIELLADAATPASADAADAQARTEIAASFIRQWKIDASLWRNYGGRIGYQQGGPEPLDAYRRFLEDARARGGAFSKRHPGPTRRAAERTLPAPPRSAAITSPASNPRARHRGSRSVPVDSPCGRTRARSGDGCPPERRPPAGLPDAPRENRRATSPPPMAT